MSIFFFFNDTATTEIYTLSLHDALPIFGTVHGEQPRRVLAWKARYIDRRRRSSADGDRKSTRLNSSHSQISYAVFCLKKKKEATAARIIAVESLRITGLQGGKRRRAGNE